MAGTPGTMKGCIICLDTGSTAIPQIRYRPCCGTAVCTPCLQDYINRAVESNQPRISCPSYSCPAFVPSADCVAFLKPGNFERYSQARVDSNKLANKKTCPKCRHITPRPDGTDGGFLECQNCQLSWCFWCHSPQHGSVSCSAYSKQIDTAFLMWTVESSSSGRTQRNARKCPGCDIYIQRGAGCRVMTCTGCHTKFCYDCGQMLPCACGRARHAVPPVAPANTPAQPATPRVAPTNGPSQRLRNTVAGNSRGKSWGRNLSGTCYRLALIFQILLFFIWLGPIVFLDLTGLKGLWVSIVTFGSMGVLVRVSALRIGIKDNWESGFIIAILSIITIITFTIPVATLHYGLAMCRIVSSISYITLLASALLSEISLLFLIIVPSTIHCATTGRETGSSRSCCWIVSLVIYGLCFIIALSLGIVAVVTTATNIHQLTSYEADFRLVSIVAIPSSLKQGNLNCGSFEQGINSCSEGLEDLVLIQSLAQLEHIDRPNTRPRHKKVCKRVMFPCSKLPISLKNQTCSGFIHLVFLKDSSGQYGYCVKYRYRVCNQTFSDLFEDKIRLEFVTRVKYPIPATGQNVSLFATPWWVTRKCGRSTIERDEDTYIWRECST